MLRNTLAGSKTVVSMPECYWVPEDRDSTPTVSEIVQIGLMIMLFTVLFRNKLRIPLEGTYSSTDTRMNTACPRGSINKSGLRASLDQVCAQHPSLSAVRWPTS